jgi:hypothetical protein
VAEPVTEHPPIASSTDEHAVGAGVPRPAAAFRRRFTRSESSPHAQRFRSATAVLVGLAVGALVIAGALAANGRNGQISTAAWSTWSPPDSGTQGVTEIAEYVAPFYRVSAVDQLAVVTVVNLENATAAAAAAQASANGATTGSPASGLQVAVKPSSTSSAVSLLSGNTVAFNLCGVGSRNCAIGVGQPSSNRLLLLRREALELALYTLKYVSGTQNVVAILPPGRTTQPTSTLTKTPPAAGATPASKSVDMAVLFERQELAPLLNEPLSATLPEQVPPSVSSMSNAPEAGLVEQVTARGLFSEQLQQAQDGSSLIVLDPLPPQ